MGRVQAHTRGDFGRARLGRNVQEAQRILDTQVLKDTTPYVPRDSGDLYQAGERASVLGTGVLEWDAPHARAQYYGLPNKSKDRHPLAVMRWFEAAKAARRQVWLQVAKAAGGRR